MPTNATTSWKERLEGDEKKLRVSIEFPATDHFYDEYPLDLYVHDGVATLSSGVFVIKMWPVEELVKALIDAPVTTSPRD